VIYESRNFMCFVLIDVRVSGFMSVKHGSKHYTTCEQSTIVKKVFRNGIDIRFILIGLIADGRSKFPVDCFNSPRLDQSFPWHMQFLIRAVVNNDDDVDDNRYLFYNVGNICL
jgi:hypothetical protein